MVGPKIDFYEKGKNVLLILTGVGGSLKGFQNKYETIAHQIMEEYDFSVAVASTPSGAWMASSDYLQGVLSWIANQHKNTDFDIYAMGVSAGGNIILYSSNHFKQIKKILAVNPILNVNFDLISDGINNFTGENITIVFGENDPSSDFTNILPKNKKLKVKILPNVDHQFTNMLQEFLKLPSRFLFSKDIN